MFIPVQEGCMFDTYIVIKRLALTNSVHYTGGSSQADLVFKNVVEETGVFHLAWILLMVDV